MTGGESGTSLWGLLRKNIPVWIKSFFSFLKKRDLLLTYLRFFMVIVLGIALILVFFANQYTSTLHADEIDRNTLAVTRAANEIGAALETMTVFAYKFQNNAAFTSKGFSQDPYRALDVMRQYRNVNPRFRSVGIYYSELGKFLLDNGIVNERDYYPTIRNHDDFISAISAVNSAHFIYTRDFGIIQKTTIELVSSDLIFVIPLQTRSEPINFAIFEIRDSTMLALVTALFDYEESDILLLNDVNSQIVWCNDPSCDNLNTVIAQNPSEQMITLSDVKYFHASAPLNYGLTFHRLVRFNENPSRLSQSIRAFIISVFILLIVSAIMFTVLIHRAYRPVRSLLQTIPNVDGLKETDIIRHARFLHSEDEEAKQLNEEQVSSLFVIDVIQQKHVSEEEIQRIAESLNLDLSAHAYCSVCVILEDQPLSALRTTMSEGLSKLRSSVQNGYYVADVDGTRVVGILKLSSSTINERLFYGRRIQSCFPEDCQVTVAFGRPRTTIHELSFSYFEARSALDYRFVVGKGSVIDATQLPVGALDASYYPSSQMQEYSKSLRSWDVGKLQTSIKGIQAYIADSQLSLYQVKCICFDMASRFLTEAKGINTRVQKDLGSVCDVFSISEFDSMQELMENITLMAARISDFMEDNRNLKDSKFLDDCLNYMRENMSNSQFSLETMATSFGVSSVYLRKQFKQISGKTLSETLQEVRIERAKDLLLTTDYNLNAIVAEIGYADVSSFIRKFRTVTGLSPGKYRAIHTASTASSEPEDMDLDDTLSKTEQTQEKTEGAVS